MKASLLILPALMLLPAAPVLAKSDAAQSAPATRSLYLNLIRDARTDGRSRAALAYLDDYDHKYPGDVEARVLRINCLLDLRETDQAEAVLDQLHPGAVTGALAAQVSAVHGHVLAARDRWHDALPFYQAAVAVDPTSAWLRNALGYALLRDGQAPRAVETLRDARDLDPDNTIVRNNLWLAYAMSGRDELLAHALAGLPDRDESAALRKRIDGEAARLRHLAATPTPSASTAAKES
jgi:Flp pilus assembly protein TadD